MIDTSIRGNGWNTLEGTHDLQVIHKALEAGNGANANVFTGGRALTPESLEPVLVNVLWNQDEARLFKILSKRQIPNPVHQWNKRTGVGSPDGAWVPEGGQSQEADQIIGRMIETAKYLQTLRKVTLQASLANMTEDAVAIEQNAGALWIIQQTERALFTGNDELFPDTIRGLDQQVTTNVLDARGASATSATVERLFPEATRMIRAHFGKASVMLFSLKVMNDVQILLKDRIRFEPGMNVASAVAKIYPTAFGDLTFVDDIFIQEGAEPTESLLSGKPGAVTLTSATPDTGATSQFNEQDAGNYHYRIAAVNRFGAGPVVDTASAVNIAAGQSVTFTVTVAGNAPTAYALYRTKKGDSAASTAKFLGYFKAGNGTADTFVDDNARLPGTSTIYVLTVDQLYNAIEWFQFLPMMKFDLYPTNEAVYPFLMLLYGALGVKKEEQHARIINVSPSDLNWF